MVECELLSTGETFFIPKIHMYSKETPGGFTLKRFQLPLRYIIILYKK